MERPAEFSEFSLIHNSAVPRGMRIPFIGDIQACAGTDLDAPDSIVIGCTSNRQDTVHRGFDAETAFIEVCLLRGFGKKAYMTAFEYECMFNKAAIAKDTGAQS